MLTLLQNEPVISGFMLEIITVLVAKYFPGLKLDSTVLTAVASVGAAIIAFGVRKLVTPTKRLQTQLPAPPPPPSKAA
jgi:hypothetical protein